MKEPQARRQVRENRGGLVLAGRKRRRGARLVVVLQEAGEPGLVVEPRQEVLAHRPRPPLVQAVVEPLVVRVVEALLEHRPLEVPVDLGHEAKPPRALPNALDHPRPEQRRPAAPGPLEDVGQDEHRHVAPHAVALPADLHQLVLHRLLRGRVAVVQLERVRPSREVGVTAVGQDPGTLPPLHPGVVLRRPRQVELGSRNVVLGVTLDPRVVQRGVIRDEVEHEPKAALPESVAQPGQRRIAAEARVHGVAGDGEPGAGDVVLGEVRQRLLELLPPLGTLPGGLLPGLSRSPDAEEPDPVEPQAGDAVQVGVGNVVQRRGPAQRPRPLRQPDAGVHLIQRRVRRCGLHDSRLHHCVGIVRTGAPSFPPVSTSVNMNIRKLKRRFDPMSRSSIQNQWPR